MLKRSQFARSILLFGLLPVHFSILWPTPLLGDVDESFPTTLVRHFRVSEKHVMRFLGDRGKIDDLQGVAVVRLQEHDDPDTEEDDPVVTVYGVNAGTGDILYTRSLSSVFAYGGPEDERSELSGPHGIAADDDGNIFVADTANDRIVHLRDRLGKIAFTGSFGPPTMKAPFDVSLDRSGRVYITEPEENRILITDYDGEFLGPPLRVPSPTGIAVNDSTERWSFFKERAIYVACRDSSEIWRLTDLGQVDSRIRSGDIPDHPESRFTYLAIDYYDNIYATDPWNHAIHKFDRHLVYLTTFGGRGKGKAQFIHPRGIGIYRRFGQTFILEGGSAQYYWVGTDLRSLDARFDDNNEHVLVSFFPTERAFVKSDVYFDGKLIRPLTSGWTVETGHNRIRWDLKDLLNRRIPAGRYTIRIEIEPTYSSYTKFKKRFERDVDVK